MTFLLLAIAILAEVAATIALKSVDGFSRAAPLVIVIAGYGTAFFFLSLVLRQLPVGAAYEIWSGAGILLITLAGYLFHNQAINPRMIIGVLDCCGNRGCSDLHADDSELNPPHAARLPKIRHRTVIGPSYGT